MLCAAKEEIEKAHRSMNEMQDSNEVIYNSLVKGLLATGKRDEAYKVIKMMRGKWVNSSIYTYNTLLNYWLHEQGKIMDARSMKKLGLNGLSPNIVAHSI